MTDNGGGRESGAADSWFKPTENRYRRQSEYQDPLEEDKDDATVFPDSGGYAGLSSSRPPMVEPYPEALGGPPPAAPPTTNAISYPGASQAAFQPLTRVPGEFEANPAQDAEERGYPGVAASAQVPLPPEESGSAGDEVWGRDSWAQPGSRAQEPGSDGPPPTVDGAPWGPAGAAPDVVPGGDAPWGASERPGASDHAWDAPAGASADPGPTGPDTDPRGPGRPGDAEDPRSAADADDAPWGASAPAPHADDAPWSPSGAATGAGPGADAPWGASGAPAAGEPAWGAPDAATGNPGAEFDAGARGAGPSDDAEAWSPSSANDAPWNPSPASDATGADAPWGASDAPGTGEPSWGAPEPSGTSDRSWDAPSGADPSLDAPRAPGTGAWNPERPAGEAPWAAPSGDDAPWGASAVADTPGADAPWGAPEDTGPTGSGRGPDAWSPSSESDAPWGASDAPGAGEPSWGAPDGSTLNLGSAGSGFDAGQRGPGDSEGWRPSGDDAPWGAPGTAGSPGSERDSDAWSPSSAGDAPWGASDAPGTGEPSWGAPEGGAHPRSAGSELDADPRGPGRSDDSDAWRPTPEADDAPWGASAPGGTGTEWASSAAPDASGADAPWSPSAGSDAPGADAPWGAPDGSTLNLGSAGSGLDAGQRGSGDSEGWRPSGDDAPWGAPAPGGPGGEWSPAAMPDARGADAPWGAPETAGPAGSGADSDAWNPSPAGDAPWGGSSEPSGTADYTWDAPRDADPSLDAPRASETGAWNPERSEGPEGWTPVPSGDDASWGAPAPGSDDPAQGAARDWDHDELGSRDWGAERRSARQDEGTEGLDSWAPPREGDEPWGGDRYADELSPEAPAPGPVASGNTWAFDRDDLRLPDVVREAEQRRREAGAGGPEYRDWGGEPESPADPLAAIADMQSRTQEQDGPGYDAPHDGGATQMFDAQGYDAPGYDEPGYAAPGYDAQGYEESGYDAQGYDGPAYGEPVHGGPGDGGATQMFDAYDEDDRDGYDDPVAQGAPSDVAPQDWDDRSEYEDGFTPADYGMPVQPSSKKRRKDPIADDFPGFGDRPLGGEAGDPYPGYDSIDHLADTERGAVVTLWLGLASLLPGIGLVTAVLALFVTGPKAKRAIRGSHGQLDGLGLITTGTVFAVVGILVTVVSALLFFLL